MSKQRLLPGMSKRDAFSDETIRRVNSLLEYLLDEVGFECDIEPADMDEERRIGLSWGMKGHWFRVLPRAGYNLRILDEFEHWVLCNKEQQHWPTPWEAVDQFVASFHEWKAAGCPQTLAKPDPSRSRPKEQDQCDEDWKVDGHFFSLADLHVKRWK